MLTDDLKRYIRESGLTAYAIGKAAGISPDMITRFVAGERELRTDTAGKLCAVLGVALRPVDGAAPVTVTASKRPATPKKLTSKRKPRS